MTILKILNILIKSTIKPPILFHLNRKKNLKRPHALNHRSKLTRLSVYKTVTVSQIFEVIHRRNYKFFTFNVSTILLESFVLNCRWFRFVRRISKDERRYWKEISNDYKLEKKNSIWNLCMISKTERTSSRINTQYEYISTLNIMHRNGCFAYR